MTTQDLQRRLEQGEIIILDGATATEVEKRGVPLHDLTWSAASILSHPDVVREVHSVYIDAGADIITTNTYSSNRNVLAPAGMGDEVQMVNAMAVTLAREAREQAAASRSVYIAGSISSENTSASFYFGRKIADLQPPNEQQSRANYREQAEVMAEAGVEPDSSGDDARHLLRPFTPWKSLYPPGCLYGLGFSTRMSADGSQGASAGQPGRRPHAGRGAGGRHTPGAFSDLSHAHHREGDHAGAGRAAQVLAWADRRIPKLRWYC